MTRRPPQVGDVIDDDNVDDALLPLRAIVVDSDGDAWQRNVSGWYCVDTLAADTTVDLIEAFGPVEVAWLPPGDPTPHHNAVRESMERRAA